MGSFLSSLGPPNTDEGIAYRQSTFFKVQKKLILLWVVFAFFTMILINLFTNIGILHAIGNYFEPFEMDKATGYDNYNTKELQQWQTCLLVPNYIYTTDQNVNEAIGRVNAQHLAIITEVDNLYQILETDLPAVCLPDPVQAKLNETIAKVDSIPYTPLKSGKYIKKGGPLLESMIDIGLTVIGMTLMGQAAVFMSWKHPGWLASAACFGLWCSMLSMTYYTADPPIPVPEDTSATLLLLLYWLKPHYFLNINDGDNNCGPAYALVLIFCVLCCFMVIIMGIGTTMAVHIEIARFKLNLKFWKLHPVKDDAKLMKLRNIAIINTVLMMCMYMSSFLGRVVTSFTTLDALNSYTGVLSSMPSMSPTAMPSYSHSPSMKPTSVIHEPFPSFSPTFSPTEPFTVYEDLVYYPEAWFPFKGSYINVCSPLWAIVFICNVRCWLHSRISPYRFAFAASFLYIIFDLPGMISVNQIYRIENFSDFRTCVDFYKNFAFIYPNEQQAVYYCNGNNFANFSSLTLCILMGFHCVLTGYILYNFYNLSGEKIRYLVDEPNPIERNSDDNIEKTISDIHNINSYTYNNEKRQASSQSSASSFSLSLIENEQGF